MLAYGGEELMIEPFAGSLFAMSPGQTAKLSGLLHGGSLTGMLLVACLCTRFARSPIGALRSWMIGGCVASGVALAGLAAAGLGGWSQPLGALVFALGVANGGYAIAAIATMMQLVGAGGSSREGVRMGLWGAAQGVAFGCGGLAATSLSDVGRHLVALQSAAYAAVFLAQALVFIAAALIALRIDDSRVATRSGRRDPLAPLAPARQG